MMLPVSRVANETEAMLIDEMDWMDWMDWMGWMWFYCTARAQRAEFRK
jgi:hypothetical protein